MAGLVVLAGVFASLTHAAEVAPKAPERRLLYVAVPGIRNYLERGGHGVLVFDIDRGHALVKRIAARGLHPTDGKPLNVKGVVASAVTGRLYVSTLQFVTCFDVLTDQIVWEKAYDGGCDRMSLSPDGQVMYLPSLEKDHWHVVDALTGDVIKRLEPIPRAHNTVFGLDGRQVYMAGIGSPPPARGRHGDAHHRAESGPVQLGHPTLHGQRPPDSRVRQRERPARLRGRGYHDG